MNKLTNMRFLIIGSKGLLGSAVLEALSMDDFDVYSVDISEKSSDKYLNIACSSEDEIQDFFNNINFLNLDGIIDCSYYKPIHWGKQIQDLNTSEWEQSLKAIVINLNRVYLPFVNIKNDKIKNLLLLGSIYGFLAYDHSLYENTEMNPAPEYLVTKAGIIGLTKLLAQIGGENNALVNCLCPGGIFNHQPESFVNLYSKKTMLGRMGYPKEIAQLAKYFLTQNSYITGQNIIIDGGYSIK
jgi:NAD(P)-dependent dehydrogenase (short-subunit alcohol dehydrogenase family)